MSGALDIGPIPPGVYVLSHGVKCVVHLTLETILHLQQMDAVVYLEPGPELGYYLESLGVSAENLMPWYRTGEDRLGIYERVVEHVVQRAAEGARCAYVAQGNAFYLDRIATRLVERAQASNLHVRVLAGVSSIDTLLVDLLLSGGAWGLQCWEATKFFHARPTIDVRAPLLLMQPGNFMSRTVQSGHEPSAEQMAPLHALLCEIYPPDAPWHLVSSPEQLGARPAITTGRLLDGLPVARLARGGTLVFPGHSQVRLEG